MTKVRPPGESDRSRWEELYAGYAEFYKVTQTAEMRARVWGWIHDPAHETRALLAVDDGDRPIGLAHFRTFARPLAAARGGFLDDLFVDPAQRGSGAADALFGALRAMAPTEGWTVIRWITAEDNYRARGVYDRVADRTKWVTYDIKI